jgi:cyanophycin synthetase
MPRWTRRATAPRERFAALGRAEIDAMEFRKVLALRGPNIWASFPVLEAWVDLKELKDSPSNVLPGFTDRLTSWLPSMIEHRCGLGYRGGFFERLRTGTYQGHILEHVTLELQSLAGTEVGYGRARETHEEGVYKVAIEYENEELGRACLDAAKVMLDAAVHDKPYDIRAEIARLRALAQNVCLGPSTGAIVQAAQARGIPTRRLNSGSLIQFGSGHKQRRILASETDRTGAIAQEIAQDKDLTRALLRPIGVPVAEGRPVTSAADAWEAAREIGGPVVVKPRFGNQGRGVATNLIVREQVLAAYEAALAESSDSSVIVERFAPGDDHRLLVVGDRVVAAARRDPARVLGDGVSTVAQLVEQVNADPRRGEDHATALSKIPLDAVSLGVLADQGLIPNSVPEAGRLVLIRRNANLSTGGTATDVTDQVHPEVAARAVEAAKVVGLDVAGVDVVAQDIGRPLEAQGGIIVEVNAAPGLRMHLHPSVGTSRPVGDAIVDLLFAPGDDGRIPIVGVTGVNGKTTTTRLIAHIVSQTGKKVGMTCTDGIFVGGRRIDTGDCSGPASAGAILANPFVEAAVLETARGGILRAGLGFDRCDVAVVTNIGEGDHLGLADIESPDRLAWVKRTLVDAVAPSGSAVLNAADPLTVEMAQHCPGSVVFFGRDAENPVIIDHRQAGGRVVLDDDGEIILAEGAEEIVLIGVADVPLTRGGLVGFQVENVLASVAACWSLGIPLATIQSALGAFGANSESVPGRFNMLDVDGATIVLDYGHNTSALQALLEVLDQFPHETRTVVYSAAGDRRDCDMIRQGQLLAEAFDRVILYEDQYTRGRADGEIMALFREGMQGGSRVREIREVSGALKSVEAALRAVRPGELLVIQPDVIDTTLDFLHQYLASRAEGQRADLAASLENSPSVVLLAQSSE